MTRLDCAIELLGLLCESASVNGAVSMERQKKRQ